jgi:uncharacterized protein YkwD
MRSCPACGRSNAEQARVCWSCGRSLSGAEDLGVGAGPGVSRATASAVAERSEHGLGGATERAVLTRYFAEPRPVVAEEGAPRPPERPIYARPRVWWEDQVRWSTEAGLARQLPRRPPPPPAPAPRTAAPVPPSPPPPARHPAAPIRIVTAPPATPAEWAARTRGSAEALDAVEPAPTRAARRLTRVWMAALAVVLMFAVIGLVALTPTSVPDLDSDPFETRRRSSAGAPEGAAQPEAGGEGAEAQGEGPGNAGAPADAAEEAAAGSEAIADPGPRLVARINEARAGAGRGALTMDEDLTTVASHHVAGMVQRDKLEHTETDLLGRRVTNWEVLAESIGVGPSVASLFDALMASEADRRNLLDPAFRHVGVGAMRSGGRLWVTVLFSDSRDPGTTLEG